MFKNITNQQQGKYNGLSSIMWLGNSIRTSLAAHAVLGNIDAPSSEPLRPNHWIVFVKS